MSRGRHARRPRHRQAAESLFGQLRSLTRLGVAAAAAALVVVVTMVAAVLTASSRPAQAGGPGAPARAAALAARAAAPAARPAPPVAPAVAPAAPSLPGGRAQAPPASLTAPAPAPTPAPTLTTADRHDCPAAAMACVDLVRHLTWLQSGGLVTFGPVQMEPGQPGSAHQTPRGTFFVEWKAGPNLVSNIYHEAMPWATFFAAGGIAFHGGSLTQWSHGCVHLTLANAHYYNVHLPVGAEVFVF